MMSNNSLRTQFKFTTNEHSLDVSNFNNDEEGAEKTISTKKYKQIAVNK